MPIDCVLTSPNAIHPQFRQAAGARASEVAVAPLRVVVLGACCCCCCRPLAWTSTRCKTLPAPFSRCRCRHALLTTGWW